MEAKEPSRPQRAQSSRSRSQRDASAAEGALAAIASEGKVDLEQRSKPKVAGQRRPKQESEFVQEGTPFPKSPSKLDLPEMG